MIVLQKVELITALLLFRAKVIVRCCIFQHKVKQHCFFLRKWDVLVHGHVCIVGIFRFDHFLFRLYLISFLFVKSFSNMGIFVMFTCVFWNKYSLSKKLYKCRGQACNKMLEESFLNSKSNLPKYIFSKTCGHNVWTLLLVGDNLGQNYWKCVV